MKTALCYDPFYRSYFNIESRIRRQEHEPRQVNVSAQRCLHPPSSQSLLEDLTHPDTRDETHLSLSDGLWVHLSALVKTSIGSKVDADLSGSRQGSVDGRKCSYCFKYVDKFRTGCSRDLVLRYLLSVCLCVWKWKAAARCISQMGNWLGHTVHISVFLSWFSSMKYLFIDTKTTAAQINPDIFIFCLFLIIIF